MTYDQIIEKLRMSSYTITSEKEITNAKQIKLSNGSIINARNM
mgnify:CR=1 FL=1